MNCDICHENSNFNSFIEINNTRGNYVRCFICPECRKKITVASLYEFMIQKYFKDWETWRL